MAPGAGPRRRRALLGPGHGRRAPHRPPAARPHRRATACSTWPAGRATSRATSPAWSARPGWPSGIDASPTMLARAVRDTPRRGLRQRRLRARRRGRAAVPRRRASTPSAASPPCTCSPTRSRRSTTWPACSPRAGASRSSPRPRGRSPPLRTWDGCSASAAAGMRMFERDEITGALASAATWTSRSARPASPSSWAAGRRSSLERPDEHRPLPRLLALADARRAARARGRRRRPDDGLGVGRRGAGVRTRSRCSGCWRAGPSASRWARACSRSPRASPPPPRWPRPRWTSSAAGASGSGSACPGPQVSEGWYGVPFARPLVRTREYVEIVRAALAREGPLEYAGEHWTLPLPDGLGRPLKLLAARCRSASRSTSAPSARAHRCARAAGARSGTPGSAPAGRRTAP